MVRHSEVLPGLVQEHSPAPGQQSTPGQQSLLPDLGARTAADSLPLPKQQKQKQQQQQQQQAVSSWQYEKGCWEAFHARDNATARFYKERRLVFAA